MSEGEDDSRLYRGSARWIIIGIIAAVAIGFAVFVAFGSALFPATGGTGPATETAMESATSGPGHNTTEATEPPEGGGGAAAGNNNSAAEQIPDSAINQGRETAGVADFTTGETNTSGNLENPLNENLTSLTGTP
jgi:hypothetical protein